MLCFFKRTRNGRIGLIGNELSKTRVELYDDFNVSEIKELESPKSGQRFLGRCQFYNILWISIRSSFLIFHILLFAVDPYSSLAFAIEYGVLQHQF